MSYLEEIQVKNLDHLGIVAGLIDEIGIVKIINNKLGIDVREKISAGTVVKSILINGLGFVSRPLYLFSQFFQDKAIEKLLGERIKPDYLNDDKIGRVMDELYKYGLNDIFIEVVLEVIKKFKIDLKYSHLDSTSFHLDGEYKREEDKEKQEEEKIIKERPIFIKKGYSRDHRPDLKRCVLDLITSQDGDIPLFVRVGDGNESDKAVFGKVLVEFKKQIKFDSIMVCDSALYGQENLQLIQHLKWITRVPMTIKKAKELVQNIEVEEVKDEDKEKRSDLNLESYTWKEEIVTYGGIKQTWLIVLSEKRQKSDLDKLEKQLSQEEKKSQKFLKEIQSEEFEHPQAARYKLKAINKKLRLLEIKEVELIETYSKKKEKIYKMISLIIKKDEEISRKTKEAGKFILATNLVEENKLEASEILITYKNQQSTERGFRFLKDPLFFTDSFFVEKPERIETMLFLMSLCLLIYNLGQRELRNCLKRVKKGINNQVGKVTLRPTLRWIFQYFQGIHYVILNGVKQIVNLTEERRFILSLLPASCERYYL
ncbi:IS1634-like element ISCwa1 family transposase [Crocosphaera watsonii]|uniref:Similar to Transposase n=1 Tax=Crocosphaera watsonii WH 8501 TaxID=165597 RepID=Q4BZW0_CROWT|nr:IS1634-like element ISCwa1 family transposase [Crocosphaera watsonii]EAM49436.1 similar to Transposase [Crocosphaera watsonii WH 8501]